MPKKKAVKKVVGKKMASGMPMKQPKGMMKKMTGVMSMMMKKHKKK